jgi:hypothetical protein
VELQVEINKHDKENSEEGRGEFQGGGGTGKTEAAPGNTNYRRGGY